MLLMNVYRDSVIPITQFGGVTMSPEFTNFQRQENWIAIYAGQGGFTKLTSIPDGNYHPVTWRQPLNAGAITSRSKIEGEGDLTANLNLGYQIVAALTGSGEISDAAATLIVNLIASISGDGTISSASIEAFLFAVASLSGSGDISDADLEGVGALLAALTGLGVLTATLPATGSLSANILSYGDLTPEGLRDAVWNAIAAAYTSPGTMGEKMNNAASAGDPWSTTLPGSYTGSQAGKLLDQIQTLVDELHKIQGLDADNPMTVTPDSRVSGAIELEITGDGETTTTVTRQ